MHPAATPTVAAAELPGDQTAAPAQARADSERQLTTAVCQVIAGSATYWMASWPPVPVAHLLNRDTTVCSCVRLPPADNMSRQAGCGLMMLRKHCCTTVASVTEFSGGPTGVAHADVDSSTRRQGSE